MVASSPALDALAEDLRRAFAATRARAIGVACSGGMDSALLLHLAAKTASASGIPVHVLHVDHGLRGAESAADASFVARMAKDLGLPLAQTQLEGLELNAPGLEAKARKERYAALATMAHEAGIGEVWLAHHRDDQRETIAMRIERRSGPRGLRGMPMTRSFARGIFLRRPWLARERSELRSAATATALPWREDTSNRDPRFFRNRLRHEVLAGRDQLSVALDTLGQSAAAFDTQLQALADDLAPRLLLPLGAQLVHLRARGPGEDWPEDLDHPLILRACAAVGMPEPQGREVERIRQAWRAGEAESTNLAQRTNLVGRRGGIDLWRATESTPQPLPIESTRLWDDLDLALSAEFIDGSEIGATLSGTDRRHQGALLDEGGIAGSLQIRSLQAGDRWQGLGTWGTKRLTHALREKRVARHLRPRLPIVVDEQGPLWAPGLPPAERARVGPETARAIKIEARGPGLHALPSVDQR